VWKRRRSKSLIVEWSDWRALATMVMGIDAKLDRIVEELEADGGSEGD